MSVQIIGDIITQQHHHLHHEMQLVREMGFKLIKNICYEGKKMDTKEWNKLYSDFIQLTKQIKKMELNNDIECL